MKIAVAYIHVPNDSDHEKLARLYVESAVKFSAGTQHRNVIICQNGEATSEMRELFSQLSCVEYFTHDDSGWDIGAYIAFAKSCDFDAVFCVGGSTQFKRKGWLARLAEVWQRNGPGIYGTLASYQMRPHLNTTGFMCAPQHLAAYRKEVVTRDDRYEFEHGEGAWWKQMYDAGVPVKLVTWCGEYEWWDWRKPENIACRGTQENCLTWFRINLDYQNAQQWGETNKLRSLEYLTDTLTHKGAIEALKQAGIR